MTCIEGWLDWFQVATLLFIVFVHAFVIGYDLGYVQRKLQEPKL